MNPSEKKLIEMVQELSKKVDELLKWKEERMKQQLTLPLDEASKRIINQ